MALVTHQQYLFTLTVVLLSLVMDPGHQRADRVNDSQVAVLGLFKVSGRGAMGREHDHGARRNLLNRLNGYRSLPFQFGNDIWIMDDLMFHVDWRTVAFETNLHYFDGAYHSSAKTPGSAENHFQDDSSGKFMLVSILRIP